MGFDKTVVSVDGVPCAARAADVMVGVLSPVVEVGPGRSSLPAVREDPAGSGPLAAIAAGFAHLRQRFDFDGPVVVVAGDYPFVTEAALQMLTRFPGRVSVVPVVAGRAQPLLARWSSEALAAAGALVTAGERSMRALVDLEEVVLLEEANWPAGVDVRAFSDMDTPEDLVELGLDG